MRWGPVAIRLGVVFAVLGLIVGGAWWSRSRDGGSSESGTLPAVLDEDAKPYQPADNSGFTQVLQNIPHWKPEASLEELRDHWKDAGLGLSKTVDRKLADGKASPAERIALLRDKAAYLSFDGDIRGAARVLVSMRTLAESDGDLRRESLYTAIFLQGVNALRRGETENCVLCRGESSCILPISRSAVHTNPEGSRLAIKFLAEYLERFPGDIDAIWLLNLAHMTLGEHPDRVDRRFLIRLDAWQAPHPEIGRFRDVGHLVKLNRFNQAGGAIMDDFDNDGLLDIVTTTMDPAGRVTLNRNTGRGTFEDRAADAGLSGQLGGLNCVQTDFNNDGWLDVFIVRGAWVLDPMRPSLLRNNQDGSFTDVTREAGLIEAVNSISASWADYDNDGWLDLFLCCERQRSRLFRNRGDSTFAEVTGKAGIPTDQWYCKGSAWLDYDNDGWQDLFLNYLIPDRGARLLHNNRNGTFTDVTRAMGIDGPLNGFSCWAWDYDNDGWQDLFATCYDRSLADVLAGLNGQPHGRESNRLYRNVEGRRFEDVTKRAGLDVVLAAMGSNFGDVDGDGWLDMYLGTGDPNLSLLVPNRMFRNEEGRRFEDVTAATGTGNLQKGHGVAFGDWDRDGDLDLFIEMGGATPADRYHNILFQNPGHQTRWLTLKLIGTKSNRPAVGARIAVVTAEPSATIHRHVTSGSSFGGNPFQQTIGLGKAGRIERLEIQWPGTGARETYRDVPLDSALEITEGAGGWRVLKGSPNSLPHEK